MLPRRDPWPASFKPPQSSAPSPNPTERRPTNPSAASIPLYSLRRAEPSAPLRQRHTAAPPTPQDPAGEPPCTRGPPQGLCPGDQAPPRRNSCANRSTVSCAARLGSRRRRLPCPADPRSCFVEPPRVDPRNPGAWRNPAPPGPRTPPLHRRRSKSPGLYAANPTASTPSVSCAPTPLASALLPVAKAHPGRQNAARRREPPCRAAAVLALTATDLPEARQGPRWTTHDA